jgi:hypothetical protein
MVIIPVPAPTTPSVDGATHGKVNRGSGIGERDVPPARFVEPGVVALADDRDGDHLVVDVGWHGIERGVDDSVEDTADRGRAGQHDR